MDNLKSLRIYNNMTYNQLKYFCSLPSDIAGVMYDHLGSYTIPFLCAGIPPILGCFFLCLLRCVNAPAQVVFHCLFFHYCESYWRAIDVQIFTGFVSVLDVTHMKVSPAAKIVCQTLNFYTSLFGKIPFLFYFFTKIISIGVVRFHTSRPQFATINISRYSYNSLKIIRKIFTVEKEIKMNHVLQFHVDNKSLKPLKYFWKLSSCVFAESW